MFLLTLCLLTYLSLEYTSAGSSVHVTGQETLKTAVCAVLEQPAKVREPRHWQGWAGEGGGLQGVFNLL